MEQQITCLFTSDLKQPQHEYWAQPGALRWQVGADPAQGRQRKPTQAIRALKPTTYLSKLVSEPKGAETICSKTTTCFSAVACHHCLKNINKD